MINVQANQSLRPALQDGQHIPQLAVFLIWMANVITVWSHRRKSRIHLSQLEEHRLRDLGLTRHDVSTETDKPFWRP